MRIRDERPLKSVPPSVLLLLAACLLAQAGLRTGTLAPATGHDGLGAPPALSTLRAASFGDPLPVAKLLMLELQSFDYRADNRIPFQSMDYGTLEAWLRTILSLDPRGEYPLMSASRIYADVSDQAKARRMLDFVYRAFFEDPSRRWPWLAHAAAIAKHRLGDMQLARRYAGAIQQHASGPDVPTWARQMQVFILEDMNELETARIMIGGFLEKGLVKDASEARFLEQRLRAIEDRIRDSK